MKIRLAGRHGRDNLRLRGRERQIDDQVLAPPATVFTQVDGLDTRFFGSLDTPAVRRQAEALSTRAWRNLHALTTAALGVSCGVLKGLDPMRHGVFAELRRFSAAVASNAFS